MKRSVLVCLDDQEDFIFAFGPKLDELTKARDLKIATFTQDREAAAYVAANAQQIFGFIQDLNRGPRESLAGLRFLNDVIEPMTPWARTAILSGEGSTQRIVDVLQAAKYPIRFWAKWLLIERGSDMLEDVVSWLLLPRDDTKTESSTETNTLTTLRELEPAWDEIARYFAHHPSELHTMDPALFERMVAQIFKSYGYQVEQTSRTRDGGHDIIATRRNQPSDTRILIEAKRFAPERPVGVGIVRSLYGIRDIKAASQVVLATTSYVTRDAKREYARVIPWQLDFIERQKILAWCEAAGTPLFSETSDYSEGHSLPTRR